jgi:hypothetical protein
MPRLAEFYGITIAMYYSDHAPPHFPAIYGEFEAELSLNDLQILKGKLPRRVMALVREWADGHREELELAWERARRHEPLGAIDPLD